MSINWQQVWNPTHDMEEDPFSSYLNHTEDTTEVNIDEITSGLAEREMFCTISNMEGSIKYINFMLGSFGYPCLLLQSPKDDDIILTVNTIYAMLKQRQKDITDREDLSEKLRRFQSDKDQLIYQQKKMEERALGAEKELISIEARERSKDDNFRKLKEKWEVEKEELLKQISSLQHRDSQYIHEIRKKERELQERLQHILNERNREAKAGMDILQTIQREGRKRGTWKTGTTKISTEEELHKMIISTYETKQKDLIAENVDLRNTVRDLQNELQSALNTTYSARPSIDPSYKHQTKPESPVLLTKDEMNEYFCSKMQKYSAQVAQIFAEKNMAEGISEEKSFQVVCEQLELCKKVIEEQDKLIQYSLYVGNLPENSRFGDRIGANEGELNLAPTDPFEDSQTELTNRLLDQEKTLFAQQKLHFEKERAKFTEASIQLAKERLEVQQLKKQLEMQLSFGGISFSSDPVEFFMENVPSATDMPLIGEGISTNDINFTMSPIPKKSFSNNM